MQTETNLEKEISSDIEFINGLHYGKPRPGHPEGKVLAHINEVLLNVDKYSTPENRESLRLIAIIHDTFKYKVDRNQPKFGENHHGMIARRFAEKYIKDTEILDIIELHDEAYNSWSKGKRHNEWDKAEKRALKLIKKLGNSINLYLAFYQCDNETGDKSNDDFIWFKNLI